MRLLLIAITALLISCSGGSGDDPIDDMDDPLCLSWTTITLDDGTEIVRCADRCADPSTCDECREADAALTACLAQHPEWPEQIRNAVCATLGHDRSCACDLSAEAKAEHPEVCST